MKWKLIVKDSSGIKKVNKYSDWKEDLALEGNRRCVYCSVRDSVLGGIRFFHVEHYRPKSKFPEDKENYHNLFYACAICNVFKGSEWFDHEPGDWTTVHYPDPSQFDYCELFGLDDDAVIVGTAVVSKYLVERLHLNRPHLIRERRFEIASDVIKSTAADVSKLRDQLEMALRDGDAEAGQLLVRLLKIYEKFVNLWVLKDGLPLYYPRELS